MTRLGVSIYMMTNPGNLTIEDRWVYFIHGWTQVISDVFHIEITERDLIECSELARQS